MPALRSNARPIATIVTLIVANLLHLSAAAGDWDYKNHGPSHWDTLFPQFCSGAKQSPVDLSAQSSLQDSLIRKFVFHQASTVNSVKLSLKNDGHKIELNWSPELSVTMGQSSTDQMYTAAQLHWHWGSSDNVGSEHTVDKRSFAAEGHLVFYNSKDYANISSAANMPNGLAVLGVFYKLSSTDNDLLHQLDNALSNDSLVFEGGVTEVTAVQGFNMFASFLPTNQNDFYRYDGSLTTPMCYESVLWTVYNQPVPISARQLQLLRRLRFADNSSMVDNYRPPLPLNPGSRPGTPRTLYRTFSAAGISASPLPILAFIGLVGAGLMAKSAAAAVAV